MDGSIGFPLGAFERFAEPGAFVRTDHLFQPLFSQHVARPQSRFPVEVTIAVCGPPFRVLQDHNHLHRLQQVRHALLGGIQLQLRLLQDRDIARGSPEPLQLPVLHDAPLAAHEVLGVTGRVRPASLHAGELVTRSINAIAAAWICGSPRGARSSSRKPIT